MSQYISFDVEVVPAAACFDVLRSVWCTEFFKPAALTGCSYRKKRSLHFVLSGYEVLRFIGAQLSGKSRIPKSVEILAETGDKTYEYLSGIATDLRRKKLRELTAAKHPSFARFDNDLLFSFLDEPPLTPAVLSSAAKWFESNNHSLFELSGTVDLSDNGDGAPPWGRSFEYAALNSKGKPVSGGHVVSILFSAPDGGEDKARLTVFAGSTIWLRHPDRVRNPHSLGGRASPEMADKLLSRLVGLCRQLAEPNVNRITYSSLGIGDSFFRFDGKRIEDFFQSGVGDLHLPSENSDTTH